MNKTVSQQEVFDLIKALTGQSNILSIPRLFIRLTGDTNTALLLSQLVYWQGRQRREDGGIYKTYAEWKEEIGLSKYQVNRSAGIIRGLGVLATKVKRATRALAVHYYLDTEKLTTLLIEFGRNVKLINFTMHSKETSLLRTETTPKITSTTAADGILDFVLGLAPEYPELDVKKELQYCRDYYDKQPSRKQMRRWLDRAVPIEKLVPRTNGNGQGSKTTRGKISKDPDKYIKGKYGHMVQR